MNRGQNIWLKKFYSTRKLVHQLGISLKSNHLKMAIFNFSFKLLKSQSRCLGVATMVLGTFPKTFSQGRLPKWQLPNCAISQVATWKNTLGKLIFGKNPWALILPHYLAHFYFRVRSWHTSKKTSQSLQINFVYKTNTETLSAQPYLSNTRICT